MEERLQSIGGIGPQRELQLHSLGIHSVSDLLQYFPRTYEERGKVTSYDSLVAAATVSIVGTVVNIAERKPRRRMSILTVTIQNDEKDREVELTYFNQGYKKSSFFKGQRIHAYGKVDYKFGRWQMNSPEVESITEGHGIGEEIVPIYPVSEHIPQSLLRGAISNWFSSHKTYPKVLPEGISSRYDAMDSYEALKMMHFPSSLGARDEARQFLAYEELLTMQMGLLLLRAMGEQKEAQPFTRGNLVSQCARQLPFKLTGDQRKAWDEISSDLGQHQPMQRLLQGDVGSGKTVVAALALLRAVENHVQGALMVPTEILATQHYESLSEMYEHLPVKIALLTGSMTKKQKEAVYSDLLAGEIDILIGTHALIQEGVEFKHLGLVIIDEQHRFGVEQRAILQQKGLCPHMLIMTATPIPRTMTLSVYGDLEVSTIKEMPPNRKPVKTYVVDSSYDERLRAFFQKEVNAGHQVYVVCPLVEESETLELKSAEEMHEELVAYYPHLAIGLLHGKMKAKDKEAVMAEFLAGRIHILVATTVIEVGVNVPNATIMCITGAERFGLSQLHQLRGRVCRGTHQGYCILVSDSRSRDSRKRLKLMESTEDGFELAEADLLMRGSGELFGRIQHGMADLKVAHILEDLPLLIEAREDAKGFIKTCGLTHCKELMKTELERRFGDDFIRILYT